MSKKEHSPDDACTENKKFHAFVDFYNQHNVIPVSQNIEEIANFIFRRDYLYTTLGAPLSHFKNRSVLEFGPGGGFNAIATSFYKPDLYVLVDASNASLNKLNEHKNSGKFNARNVEIVNSNIFDYRDSRKYDYVIIEGAICGQAEPDRMLKHVSSFVADGGVLITTTTSACSILSEICRKILRVKIANEEPSFESQVSLGCSVFKSHLDSLDTSTRPIADWVIDVIMNDWENGKYTFTLPESVDSIGGEFNFYNSSPSFLCDDRWYKKVTPTSRNLNSLLVEQYSDIAGFFIDYRISLESVLKNKSNFLETEKLCINACKVHDEILSSNNYDKLNEFFRVLQEIKKSLPINFNPTARAIDDYTISLPRFIENSKNFEFSEFQNWWGRGQQYASFIKKFF